MSAARPGGWVPGIGWVAALDERLAGCTVKANLLVSDEGTSTADNLPLWAHGRPVIVVRWPDGQEPVAPEVTDPLAALRSQIEAVRALSDAATDGPWEPLFTRHGDPYVCQSGVGVLSGGSVAAWPSDRTDAHTQVSTTPDDYGKANAEFIAAAVNLVRALVAAVTDQDHGIIE